MLKVLFTAATMVLMNTVDAQRISRPRRQNPKYHGTIFIDRNIMTEDDYKSSFIQNSIKYVGQKPNTRFWDRRTDSWKWENAHCFDAEFDDGLKTQMQVDPDDFKTEAEAMI